MKTFQIFLLLTIVFSGCIVTQEGSLTNYKYGGRYTEFLEENETVYESGYNYIKSKKTDGTRINRNFFPETKQIILLEHFNNKNQLHGFYKTWTDDGIVNSYGNYLNGYKEGMWFTLGYGEVIYKNDELNGSGIKYHNNGKISEIQNFVNGKKEGRFAAFDCTGVLLKESFYSNDTLLKNPNPNVPPFFKKYDFNAYYPACLNEKDFNKRKKCTDIALLTHIQKKLRYPLDVRQKNIEGTVVVQFMVKSDGSIEEINVIRGICQSLKNEVYRLVTTFPNFIPAEINGQKEDFLFTLPVRFKLEG